MVLSKHNQKWTPEKIADMVDFEKELILTINQIHQLIAGAYKLLKGFFFRNGRHNNVQAVNLAHYEKEVLSVVRESIFQLFITLNNPKIFFQKLIETFFFPRETSRNQYEFRIRDLNTGSTTFKILN